MVAISPELKGSLSRQRSKRKVDWFKALIYGLYGICGLALFILVFDIVTASIPQFTTRFGTLFSQTSVGSTPERSGLFNAIRGTFWIGLTVTFVTFPTGILAAIYLEEYAPKNKLTKLIRINIRNLAGVPSVVYGVLGLAVFVGLLNGILGDVALTNQKTTIAGGLTLAVLALPIVVITASEAIRAVPSSIREAAYGVGASKWQVIKSHVLPYAAPGILTGTLLTLARALGETAPLILVGARNGRFSSTTGFFDVSQLGEQFSALPILIADSATKADQIAWQPFTAAAIVVLLVIVIAFNLAAVMLRNHYEVKRGS